MGRHTLSMFSIASPNLPHLPVTPAGSTALVEACRNRDLQMIDLLLRHGARDDQCKALYVACRTGDEAVVSRLLALRAHVDPDHKVPVRGGGMGASTEFLDYYSRVPR